MDCRGPAASTAGGVQAAAAAIAAAAAGTSAAPTTTVYAQTATSTVPIFTASSHPAVPSFTTGYTTIQTPRGTALPGYMPPGQQLFSSRPSTGQAPSSKVGNKAQLENSAFSVPTQHMAPEFHSHPQTAIPMVSTKLLFLGEPPGYIYSEISE